MASMRACTDLRAQPSPVLVYFHGGGFVIDAAGYDRPLRDLARTTGCLIVAPNVRLAPEHRFPAAVEDALTVMHRIAAAGVQLAGGVGPGRPPATVRAATSPLSSPAS